MNEEISEMAKDFGADEVGSPGDYVSVKLSGHIVFAPEELKAFHDAAVEKGQQQWINMKDELPKLHQEVLVWHKNEDDDWMVSTAHFNLSRSPKAKHKTEFIGVGAYRCKNVTHWMPLPPAPLSASKEPVEGGQDR